MCACVCDFGYFSSPFLVVYPMRIWVTCRRNLEKSATVEVIFVNLYSYKLVLKGIHSHSECHLHTFLLSSSSLVKSTAINFTFFWLFNGRIVIRIVDVYVCAFLFDLLSQYLFAFVWCAQIFRRRINFRRNTNTVYVYLTLSLFIEMNSTHLTKKYIDFYSVHLLSTLNTFRFIFFSFYLSFSISACWNLHKLQTLNVWAHSSKQTYY